MNTFLHQLTIVPSVIVGDKAGILIAIPGVDPPLACTTSASELESDDNDEPEDESESEEPSPEI